ncbi:MAG: hypothetical protein F6K49_44175, partial [Moorea sp. SIO3I6]|nr:hypothetical protein [Moorena sp. SIO3I6]
MRSRSVTYGQSHKRGSFPSSRSGSMLAHRIQYPYQIMRSHPIPVPDHVIASNTRTRSCDRIQYPYQIMRSHPIPVPDHAIASNTRTRSCD